MSTPTLSLVHLVRQPNAPNQKPPVLILLHGVGSNEQDLFELSPYLDDRFLILSLRAPLTLMPGSYAWMHVDVDSDPPRINAAEAESSRRTILKFLIEAAQAYGADPSRVYLLGFSQGATMSLGVMLTQPESVAGVVALSGRILPEVKSIVARPERLGGFPVLVVHGEFDEVLPIWHGRASRDYLSNLPVDLTYREYRMGHEINQDSLADVRKWLSSQLDARAQVASRATDIKHSAKGEESASEEREPIE